MCSSAIAEELTSADGSTTKLLVRLHDGLRVEAVIMRHDSGAGRYGDAPRPSVRRATLCVSSQAGCGMGCAFCATGRLSLQRSLSACEIAEQALHAVASLRSPLRNVCFMGQGEPLDAYASVIEAIRLLRAPHSKGGWALAGGRITLSTVGVVPRMRTLAADAPGVLLALSLHAPTQELRQTLVPSAATWRLDALLRAASDFEAASGTAPLVEYVLLAGVNDGAEQAHDLGRLLASRGWTVNLIPYNEVAGTGFATPSAEATTRFQSILRGEYGINTTVRRAMGRDVGGACGQLASKCVADIEEAGRAMACG